jgi:hypothetical protein
MRERRDRTRQQDASRRAPECQRRWGGGSVWAHSFQRSVVRRGSRVCATATRSDGFGTLFRPRNLRALLSPSAGWHGMWRLGQPQQTGVDAHMSSEGEFSRRIGELERMVLARLAEQEEQLRALQRRSMPSGVIGQVWFRARRKARRAPASVRRRVHQRVRDRRIAKERPIVSAELSRTRTAIVDRYLDAPIASAPPNSTTAPRSAEIESP